MAIIERLVRAYISGCDALEAILRIAGAACFLVFMVVVILQVIFRNLFRATALLWTTELATFVFVWSVFLGAAIAVRHARHYQVEVMPAANAWLQGLVRWVGLAGILVVAGLFYDAGQAFLTAAARRTAIQLGMSQYWFYLAIPVGGAAMILFVIEHVLRSLLPGDARAPTAPGPG